MSELLDKEPDRAVETLKGPESEVIRAQATLEMGKTAVFRVMHAEDFDIQKDENGHDVFTVQNLDREEGLYGFDNFDSAATRAGGLRGVAPVFALHADSEDVSYRHEANPDSSTDVVTIRNGAQVRAQEVPKEVVEAHAYRKADEAGYSTQDVLDILKSQK